MKDDVDREIEDYDAETSSLNNTEVGTEQMDCYVSVSGSNRYGCSKTISNNNITKIYENTCALNSSKYPRSINN